MLPLARHARAEMDVGEHGGNGKQGRGNWTKLGDYKIVRDASKLDGVHVHIGVDDQLIRFSSTALSDWLGQRKIPRHTFTKEFQRQFGAKKTNGRLGSGTDRAGGTEYLWEIDAAGTALAAFIQDGIDEEGSSG